MDSHIDAIAVGAKAVDGLDEVVDLAGCGCRDTETAVALPLERRQSKQDRVDACFQLVDATLVAVQFSDESLERIARVLLSVFHCLKYEYSALEKHGESCKFQMCTQHAAVLVDSWE